jgi:hypothetical protein
VNLAVRQATGHSDFSCTEPQRPAGNLLYSGLHKKSCCILDSIKIKKSCVYTEKHMLRVAVVLLMAVTACAQQCVPFKATPTAGMCKDFTMNGVQCTSSSSPTSEKISAALVDRFNGINEDKCRQDIGSSTCTSLGGKTSTDMCKMGGNYCKFSSVPGCQTDAHCAVGAKSPVYCCSAVKNQLNLLCTGLNSSAVDIFISQAKKESGGCRDTDCLDWSSASSLQSLCTTPIVLPAITLLAIAISSFGQR